MTSPFLLLAYLRCAVHFWAPSAKWLITFANIADIQRPVEKLSLEQQSGWDEEWLPIHICHIAETDPLGGAHPYPPPPNSCLLALCPPRPLRVLLAAVTLTGLIWSRYSTQITPVNYNLLTVNVFMASVGLYQLYRIYDYRTHGTGATAPTKVVAA